MIKKLGRNALVASLVIANSSCTNSGSENVQLSAARAVQYNIVGLVKLEPSAIAAAAPAAFREEHRLVLHLRSGADKIYDNRESCYQNHTKTIINCREFILISYVRTQGMFLILKGYYEGIEYQLVDDMTGDETVIDDFPIFSPGGRRILVLKNSAIGSAGGFEIWRRTEHQFDREWAGDPVEGDNGTHVEYRIADWSHETDLELNANVTAGGKTSLVRRVHLTVRNGHWEAAVSEAP